MSESRIGFFEASPGELSMGRLLSFISGMVGILIFAAAVIVATVKGGDIGSNVLTGCLGLVGVAVTGKTVEYFAKKGQ